MVDESGSAQKREELRTTYTDALQKLEVLFNTYTQHATKANENLVKELLKEKQEEQLVNSCSNLENQITKRIEAVKKLVAKTTDKTIKTYYDQLEAISTKIKVILGNITRTLKIRKQALITVQSKNHDEIKSINDMKLALTKGDLGKVRSLIKRLNEDLVAEKNLMGTIQAMFEGVINTQKELDTQKKAFVALYSKIYSKVPSARLPTAKF